MEDDGSIYDGSAQGRVLILAYVSKLSKWKISSYHGNKAIFRNNHAHEYYFPGTDGNVYVANGKVVDEIWVHFTCPPNSALAP